MVPVSKLELTLVCLIFLPIFPCWPPETQIFKNGFDFPILRQKITLFANFQRNRKMFIFCFVGTDGDAEAERVKSICDTKDTRYKVSFHSQAELGTINDPLCSINDGIEDTEHFLLLCHAYDEDRRDLLNSVNSILQHHGLTNLSNQKFTPNHPVWPRKVIFRFKKKNSRGIWISMLDFMVTGLLCISMLLMASSCNLCLLIVNFIWIK